MLLSLLASLFLVPASTGASARTGAALAARSPASVRVRTVMLFGKSDSQQRAIDEQFEAQQAMLARRRNPRATQDYFTRMEKRREEASEQWIDKLAWQKRPDSKDFNKLDEFKKRQASGKVKPIGYEKQAGLPLPMASFGVGGEFGVGGKYDNGERFDLRLPYTDMGWIEEKGKKPSRDAARKRPSDEAKPSGPFNPFDWLFGKK